MVDLIPRDVLFGNPEKAAPAISPDGSRLAFLAPVQGVLNVWVGTVGGDDYRPVTRDTDRGIRASRGAPTTAISSTSRTGVATRTGACTGSTWRTAATST